MIAVFLGGDPVSNSNSELLIFNTTFTVIVMNLRHLLNANVFSISSSITSLIFFILFHSFHRSHSFVSRIIYFDILNVFWVRKKFYETYPFYMCTHLNLIFRIYE